MTDTTRAGLDRVEAPADPCLVAGTVPYAWPWDGALAGRRVALVLPGNDPGWRRAAPLDDAAAHRLALAVAAVRAAGGLVVHVSHPPAPSRVLPATPARRADGSSSGTDAWSGPRDERDPCVSAAGLDGFYGSPLDALLRAHGRDQLVLAGWGLEGPVHSTLRSANDQGYECLLLTDAVSVITPATHQPALSIVTMSGGIFGALGATDALCAALASLESSTSHSTPSSAQP